MEEDHGGHHVSPVNPAKGAVRGAIKPDIVGHGTQSLETTHGVACGRRDT